jgi:hypothetical protein
MERKARGPQERGSQRDALIKRLRCLRTWELLDSVLLPALMVASARSVDQPLRLPPTDGRSARRLAIPAAASPVQAL